MRLINSLFLHTQIYAPSPLYFNNVLVHNIQTIGRFVHTSSISLINFYTEYVISQKQILENDSKFILKFTRKTGKGVIVKFSEGNIFINLQQHNRTKKLKFRSYHISRITDVHTTEDLYIGFNLL